MIFASAKHTRKDFEKKRLFRLDVVKRVLIGQSSKHFLWLAIVLTAEQQLITITTRCRDNIWLGPTPPKLSCSPKHSGNMDLWHFSLFLILLLGVGVKFNESTDLYSLTVFDLQGNSVPMSVFKGKVSVQDYEGMKIRAPFSLWIHARWIFLLFLDNHVIFWIL